MMGFINFMAQTSRYCSTPPPWRGRLGDIFDLHGWNVPALLHPSTLHTSLKQKGSQIETQLPSGF